MFYPHKIVSIRENDRVLEIGPGDAPFHRSNVLLELNYANDEDRIKQFGHTNPLKSDKQLVFYDGKKFPFEDKAFDYVICSHVLEHVPDPRLFLDEMFRVAHRGYLEYPLLAYDYLYNFDVHLNFLKWKKDRLYYMKKSETGLNEFKPVQQFFLKTLEHNYGDFLGKIPHCFFEGFEWEGRFELIPSSNLNDFVDPEADLINRETKTPPSVLNASKALLQALKNKFKHV